jgi:hypothetical protein
LCTAWAATGFACSSAKTLEEKPPPKPPEQSSIFLSPSGNDSAVGEAPRRTFTSAIGADHAQRIVVDPGQYEEAEVVIDRPVEIVSRGEGRPSIEGTLIVRSGGVSLRGIDVTKGIVIEGASVTNIEDATVGPREARAIEVKGSKVRLSSLRVTCGSETCLEASGSTLAIDHLTLDGPSTRRGVRIDTSTVTILGIKARGMVVSQVQVERSTRLRITDAELEDPLGSGLVCLNGAQIDAARVRVTTVKNTGILISSCDAWIDDATVGPVILNAIGIAIEGSAVHLRRVMLETSGRSGLTINNHRDRIADVTIEGGVIKHGMHMGINHGQGRLTIRGLKLEGDPKAKTDGEDAIMSSGHIAELRVESALIDAPAGFGVGLYNNAFGVVTATITRPRLGGVIVDSAAGEQIVLRSVRVRDCQIGSGIVTQDALDVRIEDVEVSGCKEAGLLAGERSEVSVSKSQFNNNKLYGLAAFGGSEIEVTGTIAKRSKWSAFATCGDGARILDAGGNTLEGATTICP